jgi:hypothetical protein
MKLTVSEFCAVFVTAVLLCLSAAAAFAQQGSLNESHAEHAMGFSQKTTTHHFLLKTEGGIIQVEANDPNDKATQDHIRMHLRRIAKSFAAGEFNDPMEVHDEVPAGVPVMQQRKDRISYKYEATERGGRVLIRTTDPEALSAIHDFLRYQIREHKTGDSPTVR